ncbi:MAG TPA: hypothetical protein VD859_10715, partial [Nocardioides sp.]|nr:hypothetical protein [Nocardioides sp.]
MAEEVEERRLGPERSDGRSGASRNPADFEAMWRDLAPIGRSPSSGGYFRQPWTGAELELRAWFREQAAARGLELEEDPFGNLVAWWRPAPVVEVRGRPRPSLETTAVLT